MSTATLSYLSPSSLTESGLDLATSGGPAAHPQFYNGFLTQPVVAACGLLAVADVARARYFAPRPAGYLLDPVVTAGQERLRFEAFSSCGGVHARLDVLPAGFEGDILAHGTTNVDVGNELRLALARVTARDPLAMHVGPHELGVRTLSGSAIERKVPLPTRWLRGFAEISVLSRDFAPRLQLDARGIREFFSRVRDGDRSVAWMIPAGRGARPVTNALPSAVCLPGSGRLQAMRPFLRHATSLTAFGPDVDAGSAARTSTWVLEGPGTRLSLTLSPEPSRGFSGEGSVLTALAAEDVADDADLLAVLLAWEPVIDVERLAAQSGLSSGRVGRALVHLATAGRVGLDVSEGGYFHRALPYDTAAAAQLNPRLVAAEALVASGAVGPVSTGATIPVWEVRSGERSYRVTERDGADPTCTCDWWFAHRGERGPCKHALAVVIMKGKP